MERPAIVESRGVSVSGSARPAYLPALTGLRFWAAFHVFLLHLVQLETFPGRIISAGPMSVSLFFVLSGFILVHVYLAEGLNNRRAFFAARFARIYPIYLVGIVLVVLAEFLPPPLGFDRGLVSARSVLESVLLVQAWDPTVACDLNCPGWSLSGEAFFYLLFPVVAAVLARLGTTGLRAVLVGAVMLTLGWGVLFALNRLAYRPYASLFGGGNPDPVFLYHPVVRFPEFLFGVALGAVTLRSARLRAWAALNSTWLTIVSGVLIVSTYALLPDTGWRSLAPALLLPLFGALILALAFPSPQVESHFGNPLIHRLGQWSYALYILHLPVLLFYSNLEIHGGIQESAAGVAIRIAIVIGVAGLTYRFVEVPARQRLRRIFGGP